MTFTVPNLPKNKRYTVLQGDTLWSIAQKQYGTGKMWQNIAAFNGINDPRSIAPGQILMLP